MTVKDSLRKIGSRLDVLQNKLTERKVQKLQHLREKRIKLEGKARLNELAMEESRRIREAKKVNKDYAFRHVKTFANKSKKVKKRLASLNQGRSYVDRSVLQGNMRR